MNWENETTKVRGPPTEFEKLLRTPISELLKEKKKTGPAKLITLSSIDTVRDALACLGKNNILSAPVIDFRTNKFLGLVDVLDLVGMMLALVERQKTTLNEVYSNPFFSQPLNKVINFSSLDEKVPIRESNSLGVVLHKLCNPKSIFKAHRTEVLDEKDDEKILDIISQSDLVSYFSKNSEKLPEIASKSLDELKLVHPLISVRGDARLGDALGILYENRVSGVAIVEHATEHLLGNLSASDLRGFYNEYELAELNQPILEFLSKRRTKPTLFCTGKTTLKEAIARLTENRVHRLYIIDGESTKRAIGVVTLSDVLYALLPVEKDPYSTKHERDEAAAKGNKTSHSASSSSKKTKKELF